MKKIKILPYILGIVSALIVLGFSLYAFCPAINIHNPGLWFLTIIVVLIFIVVVRLAKGEKDFGWVIVKEKIGSKGRTKTSRKFNFSVKYYVAPIILLVIFIFFGFMSSTIMTAKTHSEILKVTESDFSKDIAESVGTDSIALMDTASARMLGDREIGALSDVVSQYNVSYDYTQIDYKGKPVKVSALEYAGFFKWNNNKHNGVKGYVTVDPVSMSASFVECEGMKFVPSAYFSEDALRHIRKEYPTLMLDNLHFEIDEAGKPYYVASVIEKSIVLFGGETVSGCVVLDPVSGDIVKYDVKDIPRWIDVGRILRTFKIKKNVEVTDNGKIII